MALTIYQAGQHINQTDNRGKRGVLGCFPIALRLYTPFHFPYQKNKCFLYRNSNY